MAKEYLATYLNDHLAGANFAVEILEQLAGEASNASSALLALKTHIEEDREQLRTLMARLGIAESRIRKAGSWIAEGLAEVKFSVDDDPNGPLRRLERLETLGIGIDGKLALWRALAAVAPSNQELIGLDFERLRMRGEDQRACVENWRLEAARAALAA
jgi:hypothetical protein